MSASRNDSASINFSINLPPEIIREYFDGLAKVENAHHSNTRSSGYDTSYLTGLLSFLVPICTAYFTKPSSCKDTECFAPKDTGKCIPVSENNKDTPIKVFIGTVGNDQSSHQSSKQTTQQSSQQSPEVKSTDKKVPEEKLPEQKVSEENFSEGNLPEGNLPEEQKTSETKEVEIDVGKNGLSNMLKMLTPVMQELESSLGEKGNGLASDFMKMLSTAKYTPPTQSSSQSPSQSPSQPPSQSPTSHSSIFDILDALNSEMREKGEQTTSSKNSNEDSKSAKSECNDAFDE
jgi:hypothetical protein